MPTTEADGSTVSARTSGVGLRILIVEDYTDCAQSLAMLLRLYGHEVDVAPNGSVAIEKARSTEPDVMLIDIGLPGMDGYAVAQQLSARRANKTPLLVAMTGYGRDEDRRRSAEAGFDLHLLKPVDPAALRAVLKRFQQMLADCG